MSKVQLKDPNNLWGKSLGYPTSPGYKSKLGALLDDRKFTRIGNYSHGYEKVFPHHIIKPSNEPFQFDDGSPPIYQDTFEYRYGREMYELEDYFKQYPVTSFMIARKGKIFVEKYLHERNNKHRFQSWSIAKSVTSLLLGICLDSNWIDSIDDTVEKYVPELKGTLHGQSTIRNLGNMASGAEITHMSEDYNSLYPRCFSFPENTDILPVVAGWNKKSNAPPGATFNYNELCALTIGILIRKVANMTLSQLFEQRIYQPMGGEDEVTWSTDSKGNEFNCIGIGMTTRDWCRLGMLIAGKGFMNKKQIISEKYVNEFTSWDLSKDKHLWSKNKHINSTMLQEQGVLGCGYKLFFWHQKPDGSQPTFSGHNGQYIVIDIPSGTVMVMTGVSEEGPWQVEANAIFQAAINMKGKK